MLCLQVSIKEISSGKRILPDITGLKHLLPALEAVQHAVALRSQAGQAALLVAECFVFGVKVIVLLTRADEWYCQKRYCESCVERVGFEAWIPLCGVLEKD